MIPVTKPFLPPKENYDKLLNGIWQRNWLTNNGPLVNELELRLKERLGVNHLLYVTNGTIAIQMAIKALDLKGKILTTPFSYVATTSSIVWENCEPIFVDINKDSFNIDPSKIEAAITPDTRAILATHVFGNPCDVEAIAEIAQKHNLKIIYDAAHAFGVTYKGKSIFEYGDISTTSFHATKLFHTIEGGAVFSPSAELLRKMALLRNFGHTSATSFEGVGINAKNSEFHAAMGLAVLDCFEDIQAKRKAQWNYYREKLNQLDVRFVSISEEVGFNYSYFPIVFKDEETLLKIMNMLNKQYIHPRRYFYPSLNKIDYVTNTDCPVSEAVAVSVMCLPLYHTLGQEEQDMICRVLLRGQNY